MEEMAAHAMTKRYGPGELLKLDGFMQESCRNDLIGCKLSRGLLPAPIRL